MSTTNDLEETCPEPSSNGQAEEQNRSTLGLVVVWSPSEPLYEGAWIPLSEGGRYLLGRGASTPARGKPSDGQRVVALRRRPHESTPLPPLGNPSLSRVQLSLEASGEVLRIGNHGKLPLKVNGILNQEHTARPGDVIELGAALVFVCALRSVQPSPVIHRFEFGTPDEFGILGESAPIWALRSSIERCAALTGHVLILGESGVGKELVANAVHVAAPRSAAPRSGPWVARNAATIPESLVDAELFGNAKGYPNPGIPERPGLIGAADQGTLFLDEFADLPEAAQSHLLRVLDGGEYQRLGESRSRTSHFRLVAATSRSEALLRKDLAARFELRLQVPPLRERREDIPLLVSHLLNVMTADQPQLRARALLSEGRPNLTTAFLARLLQCDFETNVRQLRQLLWRSLLEEGGSGPLGWPEERGSTLPPASYADAGPALPLSRLALVDREAVSAPSSSGERRKVDASDSLVPANIQAELDRNNGSLELTYRALGLSSRHALARLVRKHSLSVTRRNMGS